MNRLFLMIALISFSLPAFSQSERMLVRQGNSRYDKNEFFVSELKYKKALTKNPNMPEANFNLGDAYYRQKKYDLAEKQFAISLSGFRDNNNKSRIFHNLGNSFLQQYKQDPNSPSNARNLDKAIEAYKNALRMNPGDQDTKYNLSYALKLKNEARKDKNNRQKNQSQEQEKKQQQQKQDQQNQKKQNQDKEQAEQSKGLTKKQAEQTLNAIRDDEKRTQDRLMMNRFRYERSKIEKDW